MKEVILIYDQLCACPRVSDALMRDPNVALVSTQREIEQRAEAVFEHCAAPIFAANVTDDAAEPGAPAASSGTVVYGRAGRDRALTEATRSAAFWAVFLHAHITRCHFRGHSARKTPPARAALCLPTRVSTQ